MWLVDTSGLDVEVTFQMCSKCNWWIHWGKSDPEPAIYPRCSHWFPGHLAPSDYHQPLHGSYRPPCHHHHHQWQHQQQCLTQQTMHVPGGPRAGGMGMGSLSATIGKSDRTKQFFFQARCVFSWTSTIRRPLTLFSGTTASL